LKKTRVGVIGVGHLGRYHALNYIQIPMVQLVGLFDVNSNRAQQVAMESDCQIFNTLDELLKNVEAVSIAVPTDHHFETARQVLKTGIHCLLEKPITPTVEQADELIQIAKEQGAVLQIGHVERFNPAFLALYDMDLQPRFIESHRLAPFNPRGTEVAVVLDLMIHDIDIILNLVRSPIRKVDASGVAVVSRSVDIANARIQFENGCVANLTASRISQKKMRKMRLFQKEAYISIDFLQKITEVYQLQSIGSDGELVLDEIGIGDRKKQVVYHRPETPDINGLKKELEVFIQTIQGHSSFAVTGEEGRQALSVALKILNLLEN